MLRNLTIDTRIKAITGTLVVIFGLFAGLLFYDAREDTAELETLGARYTVLDEVVLPMVRMTKQLQLDVTQVQ